VRGFGAKKRKEQRRVSSWEPKICLAIYSKSMPFGGGAAEGGFAGKESGDGEL